VLHVVEDVLLQLKALEEVLVDDYVLADALHGIHLACLAVHGQVDLAEGALSDHLHDLEVLETDPTLVFVLSSEDQGAALTHGLSSGWLLAGVLLGAPALTLVVVIFVIVT